MGAPCCSPNLCSFHRLAVSLLARRRSAPPDRPAKCFMRLSLDSLGLTVQTALFKLHFAVHLRAAHLFLENHFGIGDVSSRWQELKVHWDETMTIRRPLKVFLVNLSSPDLLCALHKQPLTRVREHGRQDMHVANNLSPAILQQPNTVARAPVCGLQRCDSQSAPEGSSSVMSSYVSVKQSRCPLKRHTDVDSFPRHECSDQRDLPTQVRLANSSVGLHNSSVGRHNSSVGLHNSSVGRHSSSVGRHNSMVGRHSCHAAALMRFLICLETLVVV